MSFLLIPKKPSFRFLAGAKPSKANQPVGFCNGAIATHRHKALSSSFFSPLSALLRRSVGCSPWGEDEEEGANLFIGSSKPCIESPAVTHRRHRRTPSLSPCCPASLPGSSAAFLPSFRVEPAVYPLWADKIESANNQDRPLESAESDEEHTEENSLNVRINLAV